MLSDEIGNTMPSEREVTLTESQRLALITIVVTFMRLPNEPQEFIDVVRDRHTTTPELLALLLGDAPSGGAQ